MIDPKYVDRLEIECSRGKVLVKKGDKFFSNGIEWEVAEFTSERAYSPFGLFGTPIVKVRPVDPTKVPINLITEWTNSGGTVEFCGDSVAMFVTDYRVSHDKRKR